MATIRSAEIRDKFFEQYTEFYKGGPVPEYSSADFAYFLECHRKRLKDKGVTAVKKVEKIADDIDSCSHKDRPPYTLDMTFKECNFETEYYAGGKFLAKSDKDTETLYCNILNKEGYTEETISCPNCGHAAGARSFINGCPMCGTTFKSFKTYPCVTTFWTLPKFVERSKINKSMKGVVGLGIALALVVAAIVFFVNLKEAGVGGAIFFAVIAGLITGWIGTIMIYLLYSVILAIGAFSKMFAIAADTSDLQAAQLTKKKFENDMKRYFPDFSYEYFEGKMISLLRAIVFSDDRHNLSIYKGQDSLNYMNSVVDVEYRGAIKYEGSTVVGDILHVRMIAYVVCVVYEEGKLTKHQRAFKMEMIHKLKEEDLGFSVHAVNCATCGATFDAMHVEKCPHCGNEYHLIDDDWVVIYLRP